MEFGVFAKLREKPHNLVIFVIQKLFMDEIVCIADNFKKAFVLIINQIDSGLECIRESKRIICLGFDRWHFANHRIAT